MNEKSVESIDIRDYKRDYKSPVKKFKNPKKSLEFISSREVSRRYDER